MELLAALEGNFIPFAAGLAGLGGAIGVGLAGAKGAEAVGHSAAVGLSATLARGALMGANSTLVR